MNYYKFAFRFSITGIIALFMIIFLPEGSVLMMESDGSVNAGMLFPLLPISWSMSVLALAMNFLYVETLYIENYFKVTRVRKILPTILCLPSISSFAWFCYTLA
jgi:hypothetical protein